MVARARNSNKAADSGAVNPNPAGAAAPAFAPPAAPVLTLATVVAAGPTGMFAPADATKAWLDAGYVEVNPNATDAAGNIATRATPAGIAAVQADPNAGSAPVSAGATDPAAAGAANSAGAAGGAAAPETKPEKLSFTIEEGIAPPEAAGGKRAGGRTEMYPFEALGAPRTEPDPAKPGETRVVMASFFVPGKEPKSLASTIAGARNRYATPDPSGATRTLRGGATGPVLIYNREFKAYAGEKEGVKGTRVFRTK